jgi:hypothetical protein
LAPPYDPAGAENGLLEALTGAVVVYLTLGSTLFEGTPCKNAKDSAEDGGGDEPAGARADAAWLRGEYPRCAALFLRRGELAAGDAGASRSPWTSSTTGRLRGHSRSSSRACPRDRADKLIEIVLGTNASFHTAIDRWVFPWILMSAPRYFRVWALHKLTRHLPLAAQGPR